MGRKGRVVDAGMGQGEGRESDSQEISREGREERKGRVGQGGMRGEVHEYRRGGGLRLR